MEVYPLSIPQIDWKIYNETFQECFSRSPSRGVDAAGLDVNSPASFIATLDFESSTSPMDVLRNAARNMLLYHSFCSFIFIGDIDLLTSIPMEPIRKVHQCIKKDIYYAILTGSIDDWRRAIIGGCSVNSNGERYSQEFFPRVYAYLVQAGFREIWSEFRVHRCEDGTIIME